MPMATTQEVGPCPAAHTGALETQVSYSGLRTILLPARCGGKGAGLQAVGKSSHPTGMPTLGGLSWCLLLCPGDFFSSCSLLSLQGGLVFQ